MLSYKEFKETALNEAAKPKKEAPLKVRKVNVDWYRISVEKDSLGIDSSVVDIYRTRFNEWSVNEGQPESFKKVGDKESWVFSKLSTAKKYALDLAQAIKADAPWPKVSSGDYSDY
jgi:hypothetical protein